MATPPPIPAGSLYNTNSSNGDITSVTDNASGQTIHYFYGTDSGNLHDLIGSTEPTNAKTTYIYGDQLILPSGPAFSAYAIVTRTSDNFVWDSSLGWVSSSSNDHLSMTAIADSTGTTAWVRPDRSEHNSGHRRQHRYYKGRDQWFLRSVGLYRFPHMVCPAPAHRRH